MREWTFLTHHAHVLIAVALDRDATVRSIAEQVGISTRAAVTILNDLEDGGYLERERRGRRNHYILYPERPLRHPSNAAHTAGELIRALADLPGRPSRD
ncbi:helix-turn-helix transcriptional regulator [Agromyces indicus]|uniref:Winged helix-turn-helix domain-containing protein n=1 Tax=Agromyces indicus TaxID=758919 RepID=A0ABU1FM95_9MICO|nr:winged helix-turn-helix domain-containing protein [Agromyces indicus]MDR5692889.1 winged helix-turn-helix domain-containing protein [Agromyces indicus]